MNSRKMVLMNLFAGQGMESQKQRPDLWPQWGKERVGRIQRVPLLYTHSCCLVDKWGLTLCDPPGLQPTRLLFPWDFPGKNTGVSCHFLLQGFFPTKGSNLCLLHLLHWQEDSLPLSHLGSPQIEIQIDKAFRYISQTDDRSYTYIHI